MTTRWVEPIEFFDAGRLDLAAKIIFGRALLSGVARSHAEAIYREHLRVWNGFVENEPVKASFAEFVNSYAAVIEALQGRRFEWGASPVEVDADGRLVNGAHRVAAALVLGQPVLTREVRERAGRWDHNFFQNFADRGPIEPAILDAMTIEYTTWNSAAISVAVVFPSADPFGPDEAEALAALGPIVGFKAFRRDELDSVSVIRAVYRGEDWNTESNFGAILAKSEPCFDGPGDLRVYVFGAPPDGERNQGIKDALRRRWNRGKHSIHVADTPAEAFDIARTFFHHASTSVLRLNGRASRPPRFASLLELYRAKLPRDLARREHYCLDSGAALAAFGLRDVGDLDYLHEGRASFLDVEGQIEHHSSELRWHRDGISEIIADPSKHFYVDGLKVASLETVLDFKRLRGEPKDLDDIALIESHLTGKEGPDAINS